MPSQLYPIAETRHYGNERDFLPLLRVGRVGEHKRIVPISEIIHTQVERLLDASSGEAEIYPRVPTEENRQFIIVLTAVEIDGDSLCAVQKRIRKMRLRNRFPIAGLENDGRRQTERAFRPADD